MLGRRSEKRHLRTHVSTSKRGGIDLPCTALHPALGRAAADSLRTLTAVAPCPTSRPWPGLRPRPMRHVYRTASAAKGNRADTRFAFRYRNDRTWPGDLSRIDRALTACLSPSRLCRRRFMPVPAPVLLVSTYFSIPRLAFTDQDRLQSRKVRCQGSPKKALHRLGCCLSPGTSPARERLGAPPPRRRSGAPTAYKWLNTPWILPCPADSKCQNQRAHFRRTA
jgi:hypothetical protein